MAFPELLQLVVSTADLGISLIALHLVLEVRRNWRDRAEDQSRRITRLERSSDQTPLEVRRHG